AVVPVNMSGYPWLRGSPMTIRSTCRLAASPMMALNGSPVTTTVSMSGELGEDTPLRRLIRKSSASFCQRPAPNRRVARGHHVQRGHPAALRNPECPRKGPFRALRKVGSYQQVLNARHEASPQ